MRSVAIILALCLAGSALADDIATRANRLNAAFETWLDEHGAPGVMAVRRPDGAIVTFSHGVEADAAVELASLSKAITAVCAAALVEDAVLDWSDTVADVLGQGPDVSLSMLVTHASGITQDSTQGLMGEMLDTAGPHQSMRVLEAMRARAAPQTGLGDFAYNNENYALIALMIEAASGQPYDAICAQKALAPVGITAQASERLPAALPWGGWMMRVSDYARFHQHWFAGQGDPEDFPFSGAGGGVRYGLGTFFRTLDRGETYWHFGALCFPGRYQRGSFAVTWFAQWTVVAAYDVCVDWDAMFALDQTLARAVFGPLE